MREREREIERQRERERETEREREREYEKSGTRPHLRVLSVENQASVVWEW